MKNIKLLITDLDDTIWNWVSMWYNSFSPYFTDIKEISGIKEDVLINSFKKLHQKYHSSEVSFEYNELDGLKKEDKKNIEQKKDKNSRSIIHNYYYNKKHNLNLYPNVLSTLLTIKNKKTLIVGFTESNSFFTQYRIKTLNIDGLFDSIYTPEDVGIPKKVKRFYEKGYWDLKDTKIRILPKKTKKPNPKILSDIAKDYMVPLNEIIYIGDKLDRDIYMAKSANITNIHVAYRNNINIDAYNLLRRVTHWTKSEVEREIEFIKNVNNKNIEPDYTIKDFKDLLNLFNFVSWRNGKLK